MKKAIAVLLSGALLFSMTACGGSSSAKSSSAKSETAVSASSAEAASSAETAESAASASTEEETEETAASAEKAESTETADSGTEEAASSASAASEAAEETASSAASAASGEETAAEIDGDPHEFKLSTHLSAEHGCVKYAQKFAELLEEKSGGNMKIDIYTDGQLGGQTENCEALVAGSVDMTIIDTGTLGSYDPRYGIFDMPYVFSSKEHAQKVVSGEIGAKLNEMASETTGIHPLTIQPILFRNVLLKGKEVRTPEDLKGVKVRVPDNPSIEACFSALGATPVAMPSGEVYTAVQTGVTDGLEGNSEFIVQSKYYEVADTFSKTEHIFTCTCTCISENVYQSLTDSQKALLNECAVEAMDYFYEVYETIEEESDQAMKDAGVTFIEDVDKEALMAACKPALDEFVEKNNLQDVMAEIDALR